MFKLFKQRKPLQLLITFCLSVMAMNSTTVAASTIKSSSHDEQQIQCLAKNVYFEAGNQSTKGKIAVTNVVMNRVADKRFPKTPCAVVTQKARGICQFSWVCSGKKAVRNMTLFKESRRIAELVYRKNTGDVTYGALFFHANYVTPSWRRVFKRTAVIGDHVFYRG